MKINCELNGFEVQALFDILNHEIIKYGPQTKLAYLRKEIDKWTYDWNISHGKFLQKIRDKLLSFQKQENEKLLPRGFKRTR